MQLGQTRFYRYLGIGLFGIFCIVPFQNCRQGSTEGDLILVGPFYTNELDLFRLDRTGGGDFGYEIVDSGSFYTVQLNHFQYKAYSTNDKTFIVEKKVQGRAREKGEQGILDLFQGRCKVYFNDPNPPCPDCLTGSWTKYSISAKNSDELKTIYGVKECDNQEGLSEIGELVWTKFALSNE